jgi:hypothetical protein
MAERIHDVSKLSAEEYTALLQSHEAVEYKDGLPILDAVVLVPHSQKSKLCVDVGDALDIDVPEFLRRESATTGIAARCILSRMR